MSFGFMRSIWITLRAANYTSQALNDAARGLNKLQQAQVRLAKSSIQMGLMYTAMGAMIVQGMVGIMQMSERGQEVWERFTEAITPSLERLSEAFADILELILPFISALMNIITAYPPLTQLIAGFVLFGGVLLMGYGIVKAFTGGLKLLGFQFNLAGASVSSAQQSLTQWIPSVAKATVSTVTLGAALKMVAASAMVGLGIFILLERVVGTLPAVLFSLAAVFGILAAKMWMAAGAMSVLTWGVAAIAGASALAGAISMAASAGEYQMGTTFVRKGGLAVVHEGEEIKSARESRVQSRFDRLEGTPTTRKSSWFVPITIGTVYTRADKDTVAQEIKRALKEALDQKV